VRAVNVEIMRRMSEAEWGRKFRHPEFGHLPIRTLVEHIADHDLAHFRQINGNVTEPFRFHEVKGGAWALAAGRRPKGLLLRGCGGLKALLFATTFPVRRRASAGTLHR
jgi:hypothetical protein